MYGLGSTYGWAEPVADSAVGIADHEVKLVVFSLLRTLNGAVYVSVVGMQ